jgi:glycosyltransferase involved in cell wall biosynthesis
MHIVHVVQLYHPVPSGSVRYFVEIGKRLVAAGHRVTVLTSEAYDLEAFWQAGRRTVAEREAWHEGCHVIRFPIVRWGHHPLIYPILRRLLVEGGRLGVPCTWLRTLASLTPQLPGLAAWIDQHHADIDVLHVTNLTLDGVLHPVLDVAQRRHISVMTTPFVHIGELHDPAFVRYYSMPQQIDVLQRSQRVCTMTDREARFLQSRGVPAERCVTIGAGVNVAEVTGGDAVAFRTDYAISDAPVVVQVGAMARDKGTITTIEAMQQVWARGIPATLVLLGAPLQHFTDYVAGLSVDVKARLRIIPYATQADVLNAYAAASVFVLPSRTDSFGIVFLEAWCNRLPVIGADAGGIPDVIRAGVTGSLVPFADVPALGEALITLLSRPDLAAQYAQAGYKEVLAQHTWDHVYARIYPHYVAVGAERHAH